ncbi:hypothetical protein [Actinomadura luteofluorescens]|uniref:Uncharacterized protein n=1 Tax=Actinomadura luteofluorescens TaxID=46163 RepID=A0A7Y9EIZ2_9ACTN|nr:hypothetical protein [Actinomadura luteofluorescens]NYD48634.1 hypothetical protein [Actinomadura luteofluorescens]
MPDVGIHATLKRLRRPSPRDGFDEIRIVGHDGDGGFVVARPEEPLDEGS